MAKRATYNAGQIEQRGVTLIESLIVMTVTAVMAGLAVPSFEQMLERRHLEGTAAQVRNDLQFVRGLAVARNETLRMSFISAADSSCYVIHAGTTDSCECTASGTAVCSGDPEILRVVKLDANSHVKLLSNARSIAFDAVKGTITPTATVQMQARSGRAIHQVINVMGRVRTCSPAPALPGFNAC